MMEYLKKQLVFYGLLLSLLSPLLSRAQLPVGVFLSDSVSVGQLFSFSFSYRHPPEANVIFPDSSYNFAPLELIGQQIFPTITNEKGSLDSVIYVFKAFTIQPSFVLSLPVYLATASDSSVFASIPDTIKLIQSIDNQSINSKKYQEDYSTIKAEQPIDWMKYLKYFLIALGLVGGYYIFFWRFTYRQYLLFIYSKRHRDFTTKFKRFMRNSESSDTVNQAMILWKNHLQNLEKQPFTTLTSKEIMEAIPNQRLGEALRTMDMAIYGDVQSPQMVFAMSKLMEIANERYAINRKIYNEKIKEKPKKQ